MRQSEESKELEQFARNVEGTYDDFILFMGQMPQRDGVDKQLVQYIRENPQASHDDVMFKYLELTVL